MALLFEAELRDADVVELAEERRRMGAESQEFHNVAPYTMEIVTGVAERLDRLDAMISDHLREWTLARLPAVDRAVLRAGSWELLYGADDLASATVIDQAVLLIADLSAEKSIAYVNAVLDRVAGLSQHIRAAEKAMSSMEESVTPPSEPDVPEPDVPEPDVSEPDVSEPTSHEAGSDPGD